MIWIIILVVLAAAFLRPRLQSCLHHNALSSLLFPSLDHTAPFLVLLEGWISKAKAPTTHCFQLVPSYCVMLHPSFMALVCIYVFGLIFLHTPLTHSCNYFVGKPPFGFHPHFGLIAITHVLEGAFDDEDNLGPEGADAERHLNEKGSICKLFCCLLLPCLCVNKQNEKVFNFINKFI
jgi:hypothetical protein